MNNFGVRSANCIATCVFHKSTDVFTEVYPNESRAVKEGTYIDDDLTAATYKNAAFMKTQHMDVVCDHAGMPSKGWSFTGDERKDDIPIGDNGEEEDEKVLR